MELDLQPITLEGVPAERPLIIAGPCSAETEDSCRRMVMEFNKRKWSCLWKPL